MQPVCRNLNQRLNDSRPSSLASQGSFLERNLKAKEVETLIWISEEAEEMDEDNFVDKENLAAFIMEENILKSWRVIKEKLRGKLMHMRIMLTTLL